jgi:glycosyltransferase involved in cell wall biosynthesis
VDRAVEIARKARLPLKIAAKIDRVDREYHDRLGDVLNDPLVSFLGEVGDQEKGAFLGNARALLFPIDWPEPFGLVLIEAMACGTPVVAYPCGSVPEIIEHGITGFIVKDVDAGARAVKSARKLDRARIRARFEQRYSVERMTEDYLAIYRGLQEDALGGRLARERPRRRGRTAGQKAQASQER